MTLYQLSHQYEQEARSIAGRIRQLQEALLDSCDEAETQQLRQRITALQPILQQNRELARLTRHYYDRGCRRNANDIL